MYERMMHSSPHSIQGQIQEEEGDPKYTVDNKRAKSLKDEWNHANLALEADDLKGAWRSILNCGKSIERQLNGEITGDKKPSLSTILTFIGNAYKLPPPETSFGTTHVMIEEVSTNMVSILNHIQKAQHVQSKIRDKIYDESGEGIDSDDLLKFLDKQCQTLPLLLPEVDMLMGFRSEVIQWENQLSSLLDTKEDETDDTDTFTSLELIEKLSDEAKSLGYTSKAMVQLKNRIKRAHELRDRILQWKTSCVDGSKGSLKTLSSLVKESNRVRLGFPEALEIAKLHRSSERWIDRADVAIRSKISLHEIRELVEEGDTFPLDLSEHLDKLKARVRSADQWLEALNEVVPFREVEKGRLEWMRDLQTSLHNGNQIRLHELSSEGNRIPVDVDEAKILQIALDAKNWTAKAQKWIPDVQDSKKGKLGDIRDHLDKVPSLRDRLPLSESDKKAWSPDGEKVLAEIVAAADSWFEKVRWFGIILFYFVDVVPHILTYTYLLI